MEFFDLKVLSGAFVSVFSQLIVNFLLVLGIM